MTKRIFAETPIGDGVVHTVSSAAPVKRPKIRALMGHNLEEVAPAVLRLPDALRKWGDSGEPNKTAGMLYHCPDDPELRNVFDWFSKDGESGKKGWRHARFGEAMASVMDEPAFNFKTHLHRMLDWNNFGEGPLVDVREYSQAPMLSPFG